MLLKEIVNGLDYEHNELIKKTIRKYVNDPHVTIDSAVGLVKKVYAELGIEIPKFSDSAKYKDYEDINIFAVKELQKSTEKGIRDDSWKITKDDSPFNKDV
jgi:hypothetical protein